MRMREKTKLFTSHLNIETKLKYKIEENENQF